MCRYLKPIRTGPDLGLLLAGPLFRKKCWAPIIWIPPSPRLPSSHTHSSHHRHFVCSSCLAVWGHTKSFPLFPNHYVNISGLLPCCKKNKKCAFVGPLFCGGPCSSEHYEHA